ncbi:hypothetical protein STEG23_028769 [Scotinomys teguina]
MKRRCRITGFLELCLVFGCVSLHLLPSVTGEKLCDDRVFTDLVIGEKTNKQSKEINKTIQDLEIELESIKKTRADGILEMKSLRIQTDQYLIQSSSEKRPLPPDRS